MPLTWKDETSYSRDEPRSRTPRTWVTDTAVRIVVTRHRHYPDDTWVLRCELPGLDIYDLKTDDLKLAKSKALVVVEDKLREMLDSLHAVQLVPPDRTTVKTHTSSVAQKIISLGTTCLRLDDVVAVYSDNDGWVAVELRHGGQERVHSEEYETPAEARRVLFEFVQQWMLATPVVQLGEIVLSANDVVAVYIDDDEVCVVAELRHGDEERSFRHVYETLDDAQKGLAVFVGQWRHALAVLAGQQ